MRIKRHIPAGATYEFAGMIRGIALCGNDAPYRNPLTQADEAREAMKCGKIQEFCGKCLKILDSNWKAS